MNPSFKRVVETGYDRMAERYLASKDLEDPTTLEELSRELPPDAAVLDLGCGFSPESRFEKEGSTCPSP